ncbi:hypothetical protein ACFOD3_02055 [Falsiroseomonas tokyonensis]|uniref:ABC transporter permease n=1 Tax=Falsiroseomonas tokyonensis TaxID=430521 RepID=A0ABV7BNF1_9PROT|nr:hypothetical protein [Falsiroseomonas tokyonensis]
MRKIQHQLLLPWRVFRGFWRTVFENPMRSLAAAAALGVVFLACSTLTTIPDIQPIVGGDPDVLPRPVALFPAASALAAFCAMICGALLIWVAERPLRAEALRGSETVNDDVARERRTHADHGRIATVPA